MNEEKTILEELLIAHGVLDKFIELVLDNENTHFGYVEEQDRILEFYNNSRSISPAFTWDHTTQGHTFWCEINKKLVALINGKSILEREYEELTNKVIKKIKESPTKEEAEKTLKRKHLLL